MASRDNSIGGQIDLLAQQTGASADFVRRIRQLFSTKGISLAEDATPYYTALEQAFRREQSIRLSATQTRENLERLQQQLVRFNEVFQKQLTRLKQLRRSYEGSAPATAPKTQRGYRVVERSERRLAPGKRGKGFLVPGPKEIQ